jgi:hypothetical protein
MWAYGNHYWVNDNEGRMAHATYDSGVACIFNQGSQCFAQNQNIIMANMHYVGVLKEMILVSYGGLWLVVMKCSWIPINTHGNAIVKQDEFGFWMVNHGQKCLHMCSLTCFHQLSLRWSIDFHRIQLNE